MAQANRIGEIALPFRILPSRGEDLFMPIAIMLVGGAIAIAGLVFGDEAAGKLGFAAVGCIFAGFGVYLFRRERRYFDPKASYWMAASAERFAIVTPDGDEAHAWEDLGSFVVTREVRETRDSKTGATDTTITYTLSAETLSGRLNIDLGDFATRFHGGDQDRAEAMGAALNELRQFCRSGNTAQPFAVPEGLVVAPMPPKSAMPKPSPVNPDPREPTLTRPKSAPQMVERQ
jgi:hypothetical protein